MKTYSRGGFTLIEILIVVAIIGILASVILVGLGPTQRAGRDARRVADLKSVQTGLELYFQKNGEYPAAASGWTALSQTLEGAGVGAGKIPNDPNYNSAVGTSPIYHYSRPAYNAYYLGALLEDPNNKAMKSSLSGTSDGGNPPVITGVSIDGTACGGSGGFYCVGNGN
ncbi:MAG: prepilin-type N-terminal cleavage/methylation domain-containing protein [Patescibacteria group bacterium]|nr:prepilin-type N-terminal cleavage/methylation domain-containing protein [Patescibacteria group bacterium]